MSSARSTTTRLKFIKTNNFSKYIIHSLQIFFSLSILLSLLLVVLVILLHISQQIANISTGLKFLYLVYVIFRLFPPSISLPLHECCLNKHFLPADVVLFFSMSSKCDDASRCIANGRTNS